MKKSVVHIGALLLTLALLLTGLCALGASAADTDVEIKMTVNSKIAYVNGEPHELDAEPIIRYDRTMLPVRFIAENLGAAVAWDGEAGTATLTSADGAVAIKITIGETTAVVNGESFALDAPAFIENGRAYLPTRFVAEKLGAKVDWDGSIATATITKGAPDTDKDTDTDLGTALLPIPQEGKKVKIACIGDSITYGTGIGTGRDTYCYPSRLQKLLGDGYEVGNFGKPSAYTLAADNPYNVKDAALSYRNTAEYKNSLNFGADVVLIMLGTNDLRSMSSPQALEDFKAALIDLTKEYMELPTVKQVYIVTCIKIVNAAVIEQLSDGVEQKLQFEAAEELGVPVIDVWSMTREYYDVMLHYTNDRVHPNAESYGPLAEAVYNALMGREYTAPAPETSDTGVVYVAGSGRSTGKGETPATAVNSLAKAAALLRENGGTIVISGPYSLTYETHLPITSAPITITSVYDGVDYAEKQGARLGIAKNLYFNGDYTLENLTISSELANSIITCNYNDVTFGSGIHSTLASGITTYPLIVAGHNVGLGGVPVENVSLYEDCRIKIDSGSWVYVRCGNRRGAVAYTMGTIDKGATLTVTINGGTFTNASGTNLLAATGMNNVEGKCVLEINGGEFKGNVYAVGRVGGNTTAVPAVMSGSVELIVNGGTFDGSILAVQDSTTTVTGNYEIYLDPSMSHLTDKISGFAKVHMK